MHKVTTKNVLVSFYGEEELIEAKDFLWSDVDKLELDNMPRKISCATGDNRAKMVADDTLELIVGLLLDKLQPMLHATLTAFLSSKWKNMRSSAYPRRWRLWSRNLLLSMP